MTLYQKNQILFSVLDAKTDEFYLYLHFKGGATVTTAPVMAGKRLRELSKNESLGFGCQGLVRAGANEW